MLLGMNEKIAHKSNDKDMKEKRMELGLSKKKTI